MISHNLVDVFQVADYINVLYLGQMVAEVETSKTTSDDVVGYITGSKTYTGVTRMSDAEESRQIPAPRARPAARPDRQRPGGRPRATRRAPTSQRVRSGDMGALPAIAGFVVLSILFTALSPYFLTERNFANLLTQAATARHARHGAWSSSSCSARSTSRPASPPVSRWPCSSCSPIRAGST